jgi:hypothetical protein
MRKPPTIQPALVGISQISLLAWLATCASVFSFLYYFRNGEVLLYGDAVAHINIARRIFDSKTPGLLQLGTVWLPLPHLLMVPFLVSMKMWRSGAGGSISSMIAYVFGVVGIFRLTRDVLSGSDQRNGIARVCAWIAALIYATNPNLIYMQATAMGEAVYLAFFIWAVVYFSEAARSDGKALTKCAVCLAGACLTRYDGWFLAVAMSLAVLLAFRKQLWGESVAESPKRRGNRDNAKARAVGRKHVIQFVLIAGSAPALWLAYNGLVYRNPLEFENGPYSAKAIEGRTQTAANPSHPGSGNPLLAGRYFVKAAEDNVASREWLQRIWILLAMAAILAVLGTLFRRTTDGSTEGPAVALNGLPLLFLLTPIPFYALSVAHGGVPIFIPQWWPFSHYNVRYGLQLLPAFSVVPAILAAFALRADGWNRRLRLASVAALLVFVIASYASVWRVGPTCLEEARINMRTRNQLEIQVSKWLEKLPADATLLVYVGDHVGAVERAGIPLKHTINEGNHRVWKQPADVEGLWERALVNPPQYADYVLAFEGDPVWQAVHDLALHELVEVHVTGQARAVLYRAR